MLASNSSRYPAIPARYTAGRFPRPSRR